MSDSPLQKTYPVVGQTLMVERRCRWVSAHTIGRDCVAKTTRVRGPAGTYLEPGSKLEPGDVVVLETAGDDPVIHPSSIVVEFD